MMPFLPIFVFGGIFLAFSGQTLFGSNSQATDNEQTDSADAEDNVVAVKLPEAELADAIAIYIKPKGNK